MHTRILILGLLVASWVPAAAAYERLVKLSPYAPARSTYRDKVNPRALKLGPYAPAKTLVVRTPTGVVHADRVPGFDARMSRGALEAYVRSAGQHPPTAMPALRALARRIARQRNP